MPGHAGIHRLEIIEHKQCEFRSANQRPGAVLARQRWASLAPISIQRAPTHFKQAVAERAHHSTISHAVNVLQFMETRQETMLAAYESRKPLFALLRITSHGLDKGSGCLAGNNFCLPGRKQFLPSRQETILCRFSDDSHLPHGLRMVQKDFHQQLLQGSVRHCGSTEDAGVVLLNLYLIVA